MLFRNAKERYMIEGLSAVEFSEKLIDNIDLEKKGIFSDSKNEFYGTVSKNSFTLTENKPSFRKGFSIYGEFEEDDNNVVITLEYKSSQESKIAIVLVTVAVLYFLADALFHSSDSKLIIFLLVILTFCILAIIANVIPRQNELYLALKRIFRDKKIRKAKFVN